MNVYRDDTRENANKRRRSFEEHHPIDPTGTATLACSLVVVTCCCERIGISKFGPSPSTGAIIKVLDKFIKLCNILLSSIFACVSYKYI